jgi:uncharacterized membrane protein YkvA (DUF1232 family)
MSRTTEIRALIARHRGKGPMPQVLRSRLGGAAPEREVAEAAAFCREILDAVPVLIDRVREAAAGQGLGPLVEPMLAHAEAYFLRSADVLPDQALGEVGLLDDAWLALSIVRLIGRGRVGLVRVELDAPLTFLEQVLGEDVIGALLKERDRAIDALEARAKALEAAGRGAGSGRPPGPSPARPPSRPSPAPGRQFCGACSGTGRTTCGSCGGYGYHTRSYSRVDWRGSTELVTERIPCGCSGGQVTCGLCNGLGYR